MPANPQINAFLATHQTAIGQLANAYCQVLVGTQQYRDTFFAGSGLSGLDAAISSSASAMTYFGNPTGVASVVTPLVNAIVAPPAGQQPYPQAVAGMTTELQALLPQVAGLGADVSKSTIAACTAALGSAAATLQ
jgi:hypothetical protein